MSTSVQGSSVGRFADLKNRRWFLPKTPDVIGMLQAQAEITVRGMKAFTAWAAGDSSQADDVRVAEHECDKVRRQLVDTVREAFTTPIPPEDLFQLSRDLDRVINGAKDAVRESEAMSFPPDQAIADMALLLLEGVVNLQVAFTFMEGRRGGSVGSATKAADAAVSSQRNLERVYRRATGDLVEVTDIRVAVASRELYRRVSKISDDIVLVADRIWYSRVKES
jgi:uncharacterized protein Yka (UPF0111/DUF47 family)